MLTFCKRLLWDESAFERYGRALIGTVGLAMVINGGKIPQTKGEWFSLLAVFLGLLIGSGDKNPNAEAMKKMLDQLLAEKNSAAKTE